MMKRGLKASPRFLLDDDAIVGGVARITGAELHHLRDVARITPGAEVTLIAGDGVEHLGRVLRFEDQCALVEIVESRAQAPGVVVILAAAIIKGPRMDFLVEKAAELGATELWPLACARSVARDPGVERLTRWRRLAAAAAKQSLAARVMEIRDPITVAAMARNVPKGTLAAACTAGAEPLGLMLRRLRPRAIILACGPEGGFDENEAGAMNSASFVAASLGHNRLRSETAGLTALAIAGDATDEFNRGS
jgi:16S rRNA (uracil1498-N3)-methyltransferase